MREKANGLSHKKREGKNNEGKLEGGKRGKELKS